MDSNPNNGCVEEDMCDENPSLSHTSQQVEGRGMRRVFFCVVAFDIAKVLKTVAMFLLCFFVSGLHFYTVMLGKVLVTLII